MKKDQFERAKASSDPGVLVHLVCNAADGVFYSEDPDALPLALRTVLCVETFFSAMCDGGFAAWFEVDHGQLACCAPEALRRVDLPHYAALAEQAVRLHHQEEPLPSTLSAWQVHLERIRGEQAEEDCSEKYAELEAEFFGFYQDQPREFREQLFKYIVEHEDEILLDAPVETAEASK